MYEIFIPCKLFTFLQPFIAILNCEKLGNGRFIKIPTLIKHGAKDVLVPPQNAKILTNLIPNARVKIFAESAHAPYVEEPDAVIDTMVDFLL